MPKRLKDSTYEPQHALRALMKQAGVSTRDIATLWSDPVSTARGRLNGNGPITPEHRISAAKYVMQRIREGHAPSRR